MHLLQPNVDERESGRGRGSWRNSRKKPDTFTFKPIRLIDWRTNGQTNEKWYERRNHNETEYMGQSFSWIPLVNSICFFFCFTLFSFRSAVVWVQFRVISKLDINLKDYCIVLCVFYVYYLNLRRPVVRLLPWFIRCQY